MTSAPRGRIRLVGWRFVAALVATAVLAGCGGGGSPKAAATTSRAPRTSPTVGPTTTLATTTTTAAVAHPALAAEVIAAPPGFALSTSPEVHNGPLTAPDVAAIVGDTATASQLHLVSGYAVVYDSATSSDSIEITLFDLADSSDADLFRHAFGLAVNNRVNAATSPDPAIPGAADYNATKAESGGGYDHLVVASKANRVMVVDYVSGGVATVPTLPALASQQYAHL